MIDHSLLQPTLTDQELEDGCRLAIGTGWLQYVSSPIFDNCRSEPASRDHVKVGAVIGFPHGNSATESKRYERRAGLQGWGGRNLYGH